MIITNNEKETATNYSIDQLKTRFSTLQMTLQVSWVRHRDVHLLTIGRYTYTNDQRFRPIHNAQTDDWTLEIKYPQLRDSGYYECQVSTTPHMSHIVYLDVIGEFFLNIFSCHSKRDFSFNAEFDKMIVLYFYAFYEGMISKKKKKNYHSYKL